MKKLRSDVCWHTSQSFIAPRLFNELADGGNIQEIARLRRRLMQEQSRDLPQKRLKLMNQPLEMRFLSRLVSVSKARLTDMANE